MKNNKDHFHNLSAPLHAPKTLAGVEDFKIMVDQLSEPAACVILGVHRTTLRRWLEGSRTVPRYAVLALYWETPWGRGVIDSDHMRALNILYHEISFLRGEKKRLEAALIEMEKMHGFDSANTPVYKIK